MSTSGVGRLVRSAPEKRLGTFAIFEPGRVDTFGTHVEADEIERVAHLFLRKYRAGAAAVGLQHASELMDTHVVESWVSRQAEQFGDVEIPPGSWLVTLRFDEETWARVKSGELSGISFGGYGEIDEDPPG